MPGPIGSLAMLPGNSLCASVSRSTSVWSAATSAASHCGARLSRSISVRLQPTIAGPAQEAPGPARSEPDPDEEDVLDQCIVQYLREHPRIAAKHTLVRKSPGVYCLDGREIEMEWQCATPQVGIDSVPVVLDGPLRQPLTDYIEMTETRAEYEAPGAESMSTLHMIPKEQRLSFDDEDKKYSRLEAMKVAKQQALVREKAADCTRDGRAIPVSLLDKYNKTIQSMGPMTVEEVLDRCRWTPTPNTLTSRGGC